MMRSASASMRNRWSPTTLMSSVKAMPTRSIAKPCQVGLAPRPGSVNLPAPLAGTVLARVRPAGLTMVPMMVS